MGRPNESGWTVSAVAWEEFQAVLTEHAWRYLPFLPGEERSIPTRPGIYAICAPPVWKTCSNRPAGLITRLYNVHYIGQTLDVRRRFTEHVLLKSDSDVQLLIQCYGRALEFWWTETTPSSLDAVESVLIQCLRPFANRISGRIRGRIRDPIPAAP